MKFTQISPDWVARGIGISGFNNATCIGVTDASGIIAGVAFHDWQPDAGTIQLSAYAKSARWLTRDVIGGIMEYPFGQLDCQMITAQTSVDNTRTRKLWRRLGAREFVIPRLLGREKDGAVLTLTKEAWKASKYYGKTKITDPT